MPSLSHIDIIPNLMGVLTFFGVPITSRKVSSSTSRTKAPSSLLGARSVMYQASLFFVETMVISNIQSTMVFFLVATLCEVRTIGMVAKSKSLSKLTRFPQHIFNANETKVPKVHLKFWNGVVAKLQDLFMHLAIN